jgi:hypothetical protein
MRHAPGFRPCGSAPLAPHMPAGGLYTGLKIPVGVTLAEPFAFGYG